MRPLLYRLNAKQVALPWLNGLVVQFGIAQDEPLHPLTDPQSGNDFLEMVSPLGLR